jgi:hypothetical protein
MGRFFQITTAVWLAAACAWGQSTFGSITGTVTDPSGAVVASAKVRVVNEGQGTVREAITNSAGTFSVPDLDIGTYRVEITAPGLAAYQRSGMALTASQVLNVDAHLSLTQTSTTVDVSAQGSTISTESSNLSNLQTNKDMEELPLIARTQGAQGYSTYILFNPGVSSVPGSGGTINVQGLREGTGTLPTMDGLAVMAFQVGSGPIQPSLDAVQEVSTQLANTPADFSTGGNFTVVSRAGTNAFHAQAFWEYNSGDLNARDFFATTVPFRVYNNFGASGGGAIRKNKTFYFVDYEGSREAAQAIITATTGLPAWRAGDFSALGKTVTDPTTGQPFAGGTIPASRVNPISTAIQNYFFPLPNYGPAGLQSGNWRGTFPANSGFYHWDDFGVRIDQNFREKDKVFGRFNYRRMPQNAREPGALPPEGQRIQTRYGDYAVLSWTHLFAPTLLNEFRAGFARQENYYYPALIGSDILQQIGMPGTGVTGLHDVPAFYISGSAAVSNTDQAHPQQESLDTNYQWVDNLTWTKGRHTVRFGADFIRDQLGGFAYPNSVYGQYNFTGIYTGVGYADFLLGIPQTTSLTIPTPRRYLRATTTGLFVNDQFKLTPRLTLNYGLRWELLDPYHDTRGSIANFDPANEAWVVPNNGVVNPFYPKNIPIMTASQAGYPGDSLVSMNWHNIEPRVGLAFKPFNDDKTVIRGGYGIFPNLIYGLAALALTGGPFSGSTTYNNVLANGVPLITLAHPFLPSGTTGTQNAFGINPNIGTPYSQQWNLTVERQIGKMALHVSYVGARSVDLIYTRNLNQPLSGLTPFTAAARPYSVFNSITYYDQGGRQFYNGLETSVSKTFGSNLSFNAGWTYSKDLTDTQDSGGFSGQTILNSYNRNVEWANNQITPTHRAYGYVVYMLPFGHKQAFLSNAPAAVQGIVGGWQMAWNVLLQSGQFFTPSYDAFDSSNTNTLGGRPDAVPGVPLYPANKSINNWFTPAAFAIPGCPASTPVCSKPANVGRFGDAGLMTLRGPRTAVADLALSKWFSIKEKAKLQLRVTAANVFNHPSFGLPAADISSAGTVGKITSDAPYTSATTATRSMFIELRLVY